MTIPGFDPPFDKKGPSSSSISTTSHPATEITETSAPSPPRAEGAGRLDEAHLASNGTGDADLDIVADPGLSDLDGHDRNPPARDRADILQVEHSPSSSDRPGLRRSSRPRGSASSSSVEAKSRAHAAAAGDELIDTDLEAQILSSILCTPALFRDALLLGSDAFADDVHSDIWAAMLAINADGNRLSLASVQNRLRQMGADRDTLSYLSRLAVAGDALGPALTAAVEDLRQMAIWRSLCQIEARVREMRKSGQMSADDAVSRLIGTLEHSISDTGLEIRTKRQVAASAVRHVIDDLDSSTPTGIYELDLMMLGGPKPSRLYGVGGLFGRGKTILLGSISDNLNGMQCPHLHISLETEPEDIEIRNMARAMDINSDAVYDPGNPNHGRFVQNAQAYCDQVYDFTYYAHKPGASKDEIQRLIIQAVHKHGIKGFLLDYWQLMEGREKGQSEDAHLRSCANMLAALCRRERIWGIVAVQVDEVGQVCFSPKGMKQAASLFITLKREPNEDKAMLITDKSNYTPYANIGVSAGTPGLIFDRIGPHFRSPSPEDQYGAPD